MTTSPVTNLFAGLIPGQAGQTSGQPGAQGSTADAFLALVQGLLDDASAQPTVDAAVPGLVEGATEPVEAVPATTDGEAAPVLDPTATMPDPNAAAAAVVPVFVQQAIQIQPAAPAQPQPSAPEASAPVDAVASVAAVATATTAGTAAATTAPVATTQATQVAQVAGVAEAGVTPAAPKAAAKLLGDAPTTTLPADGPAPATATASKVELPDVAVQAVEQRPATAEPATQQAPAPAAPTPAPTQAPSVAPVSGVAPVATTAAVAPAPTDTHGVTQQVFPEVVRVVNNPNGPQRVTIKLNPEALGEVRVVLTSRQGALEVSLAAGTDARVALAEGASELHRLLDLVGRGDARVVVRELNGTTPGTTISQPASTSTGSGVPTDLAGGAGNGTGRPGGEATSGQQHRSHASGSNNATDGTQGAANPSRPTDSVTRAHTGLDVTM